MNSDHTESDPVLDGSGDSEEPIAPRENASHSAPCNADARRGLTRRAVLGGAGLGIAAAIFAGGWFARGVTTNRTRSQEERLREQLFPAGGITPGTRWGDIPARLVREGVIDPRRLQTAMALRGLKPSERDQLEHGADQPLHIDSDNASYVLDVLWAFGLANRNPVLTHGEIARRGATAASTYASTGGWTLGAKPGSSYLAALDLVSLTGEQQAVVEGVAAHSYRPCCNNATAFPDCNHGMAVLGLTELMASQGATETDVFSVLKAASPFWFPVHYYRLAVYFEAQGTAWPDVDPRQLLADGRSSAAGWSEINAWLERRGFFDLPGGSRGGTCAA